MMNLVFFSIIFSLMVTLSFGAMNLSGVNRTFLSMHRGIFESSVVYVDEEGKPVEPYYLKETLQSYVTEYLEENLTRYVTHYEASIYYFDHDTGEACLSNYCKAVRISLECQINYLFHYSKARDFYINAEYEPEIS